MIQQQIAFSVLCLDCQKTKYIILLYANVGVRLQYDHVTSAVCFFLPLVIVLWEMEVVPLTASHAHSPHPYPHLHIPHTLYIFHILIVEAQRQPRQ